MENKFEMAGDGQNNYRSDFDVSGANEIIEGWPSWKRDLGEKVLRPTRTLQGKEGKDGGAESKKT